jgi:hypothetical protein
MLRFDLENELDIRKQVKGDKGGPKGTTYNSCTYLPCYLTVLNGPHADDYYEFLPPSKRTVLLRNNMREEIAQFVIANHDPKLPEISEAEAMHCIPRDGVKWGKMTVNGEQITASWAYRSEKYQRRANYVRVCGFHIIISILLLLRPLINNSIMSYYLGKMYSTRQFTMAVLTRYGHCK